jgi:hypothetical protein
MTVFPLRALIELMKIDFEGYYTAVSITGHMREALRFNINLVRGEYDE